MVRKFAPFELQGKLFRGFADPSRLSILESLRAGPLSVSEIIAATGLTQSNVSNHLRCLSECGLVEGEQEGRFVHYHLSDPLVGQLLALADEILANVAKNIDQCKDYSGQ